MFFDIHPFINKNLSRSFLIIPFGLIFVTNLLITQINGFEYAGELAIFSGSSSFLAILFGMQWDIEVLVRNKEKLLSSIYSGIATVTFLFLLSLILYFVLSMLHSDFYLFLISSAALVGINEILLSSLIKLHKYKVWIFIRSIPPIALLIFSTSLFKVELAWFYAQLIATILVTVYYLVSFNFFINKDFTLDLKNLFFRSSSLIPITLSTLMSNSILLFCLLGISYSLSDFETGLWVNAYRIFSLPIVLAAGIAIPFVLSKIGDSNFNLKFKIFFKYFIVMLALIMLFIPMIYFYGTEFFKLLTNTDYNLESYLCIVIYLSATMHCLIQNMRSFFHSINRVGSFLFILVFFILLIGLLFINSSSELLELISERIFYITFFVFTLIILNLWYVKTSFQFKK